MLSFDAPRLRPAPTAYLGVTIDGRDCAGIFSRRHLVIAVKSHCDGCRELLSCDPDSFGIPDVLFVYDEAPTESWIANVHHEVVVSPALLTALEVRSPPLWILVDGEAGRVIAEGVPFGVTDIRDALAQLL